MWVWVCRTCGMNTGCMACAVTHATSLRCLGGPKRDHLQHGFLKCLDNRTPVGRPLAFLI